MKRPLIQTKRRARREKVSPHVSAKKVAVHGTREWEGLESELGYSFRNIQFLRQALTHSSYSYEQKPDADGTKSPHNEQMEFLGDAVLGFLTGRALYDQFPSFREGQLSRTRAQLVRTEYLAVVAKKWDLG